MYEKPMESLFTDKTEEIEAQPQEWTADQLWSAKPNVLRLEVSQIIASDLQLLDFYKQEARLAKHTDPEVASDTRRYIGFPLVEALSVVERVRQLVNNDRQSDLQYDWLNLSGIETTQSEDERAALAQTFNEPRYRTMDSLIDEVKTKTGILLNREVHDELSAKQTQYYISWFLIEATDINWRRVEPVSSAK